MKRPKGSSAAHHLPLFVRRCEVRNSFGVVLATATGPETAHALAELANLGGALASVSPKLTERQRALVRLAAQAHDDLLKPGR